MKPVDDATRAQLKAARPDASTWLAANAGSGKTRVLTDRVARLLLDGVDPQNILCLTYTKAAASEMQNRLFKRLGAWAMSPDDDLRAALEDLGVTGLTTPERLNRARTLFALAIETPGGLKIQTIHSFCAALLRRFPLEARVSPNFKEIEERASDLLRTEIIDQIADGPDADVVNTLVRYYTGENFNTLTKAIVGNSEAFSMPLDWPGALALFGLPPDTSEETIETSVFLGSEAALIDAITPIMLAGSQTDEKNAKRLLAISNFGFQALPELEKIFLTGGSAKQPFSAKIGSFPTKATSAKITEHLPALETFMARVEGAREARLALKAAKKTQALHAFATRFIALYEEQKLTRGWLDFDDLILKARHLLTDSSVAAWVLYRIDGGIDHILVDEAQDTSPAQWDVVRKLAAEFSSGEGARSDRLRTIFVVGDKKQSIYSFQGADPKEFDRMEQEFKAKLEGADLVFQSETLAHSFRSSPVILDLVDRVFEGQSAAGFSSDARHQAFHENLPGRVDLWPAVEKNEAPDDREWFDPLDRRSPRHHTVILAEQIAQQIKAMIGTHQTVPDIEDGKQIMRPVRAGDFLILVQRRSELFAEIIRACKALELPIAGADRLKVGAELAVRDLAALLSFLAVSDDDLSLATALKSPLFGWNEQALFTLAHHRKQDHLWQALRQTPETYPETYAMLRDLRDNADYLRPYDLIERILTRHNGRRNLLSRLGPEAEDGINALLSQALSYEQSAVPSLTGFLVWLQTDELEIKRQIDAKSNQIRVMTVHGSKGLEAPIVILPDTGARSISIKSDIVHIGPTPVWKTNAEEMPAQLNAAVSDLKDAEINERLRLLYVALTRAEKWLIVATAGDLPKDGSSWYQMIENAMKRADAADHTFFDRPGLRLEHGDWSSTSNIMTLATPEPKPEVEACFFEPAKPFVGPPETLSPSDLGGAKALAGEMGQDEQVAKSYGTRVHLYLEHLSSKPASEWAGFTAALAAGNPTELQAAEEAQRVLSTKELAFLFTPDTLAEVRISGQLGQHPLQGAIDRLIVTEDSVLAVDFKTNRTLPSEPRNVPLGVLRQMGAYAHALAQVYPGRRIETAIVWTFSCTLMRLPHDIVTQALHSTPYLDDADKAP